jgi:hypothetical protein
MYVSFAKVLAVRRLPYMVESTVLVRGRLLRFGNSGFSTIAVGDRLLMIGAGSIARTFNRYQLAFSILLVHFACLTISSCFSNVT